jgi:VanZ family protein
MINFIPALIWMAIIAFLSLIHSGSLPSNNWFSRIHADKIAHIILYAILSLLLLYAFSKNFGLDSKVFIYAIIISGLFGIFIEMIQSVMNFGRSFELLDILANITGAFVGASIYKRIK